MLLLSIKHTFKKVLFSHKCQSCVSSTLCGGQIGLHMAQLPLLLIISTNLSNSAYLMLIYR